MKIRRSILALGAFFVIGVGMAGCGSGVPGDAVVNVAGNPISTQAFNHWMYVAAKSQAAQTPGSPVIVPNDPPNFTSCIAQAKADVPALAKSSNATVRGECQQAFTALKGQVLDFLIKAYWYQAEAHKLGITVTNAQIQTAFQTAKKQEFPTAAQFASFLSSTGQTLNDILYRVRVNQIFMKLSARYSKPISAAEIQAYYTAHASQFGTPESVNLNFVRTKTLAAANAAHAALASGQSFKTVAKKYSQDAATKNNGGKLTGVTQGEEEAAFSKAIFEAPQGKLVGPVHGQFGYYVFEVSTIHAAKQEPLAKADTQIKQLLNQQLQTSTQAKVDAQAKAAWFKKTTCRKLYAMADCSNYKAPKATTGATGATGATG
jgi:foldase protein PrsA